MKTASLPKDDVYNLIKSHKEGISVFEIEEQLTGKSQEEIMDETMDYLKTLPEFKKLSFLTSLSHHLGIEFFFLENLTLMRSNE